MHWGFFLSISRRIIPYRIFSPKQMISWQIWKMIFALIGAGLSWLQSEAGLAGIVILLIPQVGWLLFRGRNCGGCTLPPFFTFLVSEDLWPTFSGPVNRLYWLPYVTFTTMDKNGRKSVPSILLFLNQVSRALKSIVQDIHYSWISRYVIATMLEDENKRFLICSFCSSTNNCTLQLSVICVSRDWLQTTYWKYNF